LTGTMIHKRRVKLNHNISTCNLLETQIFWREIHVAMKYSESVWYTCLQVPCLKVYIGQPVLNLDCSVYCFDHMVCSPSILIVL